jgi:protein-disulfide isomerase
MMRTLLLLVPALILFGQTTPAPKAAATVKTAAPATPAPQTNYKESGSASAAVEVDAYTDYECPHCARFFKEFMPQFSADYIKTGKVRFVHRDLPLVQIHPHTQLAARFANAAGEVGFYDLVVNQLFKTQDVWSVNAPDGRGTGNIDAEVAKVLPPGAMQKVRDLVKSDPRIDASIAKDVAMATNVDRVPSTPTIVVIAKGKRDVVSTIMDMPYNIFKQYLDQKIAAQ